MTIRASLQRYDGAYHRDEVKTFRSRRTLGVPEPLAAQLRQHRRRQLGVRLQAGPAWKGNDWDLVFTTPSGTPIYGSYLTRTFQRALAAAGLPRQRFHDMRHAAASFMLAQGVPLAAAQRVLGHSSIAVTNDIYGHITVDATRDAPDKVGKLLWRSS